MITKLRLENCLTNHVHKLPYVENDDVYDESMHPYIKVIPKSIEELISMGAIDEYGDLRDSSIGISREMTKIIKARQPIWGFVFKDAGGRYYIKHNSYYYVAKWFSYGCVSGVRELQEFT